MSAQSDNEFWLKYRYLSVQIWRARVDFVGLRITVSRRSAFHDVCDEDIRSRKPNVGQQIVEESAGCSDKGLAFYVFRLSWCFSDEQHSAFRVACSGDSVLAAFPETAFDTNDYFSGNAI